MSFSNFFRCDDEDSRRYACTGIGASSTMCATVEMQRVVRMKFPVTVIKRRFTLRGLRFNGKFINQTSLRVTDIKPA